jgi:GNAT superfamily N-acetyltransferase
MTSILHLRKELSQPPVALSLPEIGVRPLMMPDDVPAWLALRDRAMADESPSVRSWSAEDFGIEMLRKSWWQADRTWLAIAGELRLAGSANPATRRSPAREDDVATRSVVGAVTLAMRQGTFQTVPAIHWLLVDPTWRRRGIGRLLISRLERAAWNAGWREVQLETHTGWSAAVAFYQSMGYAPLRDRSPG